MSGRQTIKQRIAFEGGEEMKAQLQALGETGEKALQKISAAAKQADFAKLGTSLKRVGDDLATVGKRIALGYAAVTTAATAAAASVVLLAKNTAMVVTESGKAAQSAGLQVDAYGRLAFAAEAAYVSQGELQAGLSRLNKELGAAAAGNKASADKFKMLGIAVRDANGRIRPTEMIVRDLARVFARMPDSAKKSALAMDIFGKSGANLIPFLNQGAEGLKELGDKAERLGIVFSPDQLKVGDALRTALDDLGTAVKAARVQLGLLFAPGVTRGANQLRDMIVQNRKAILDFVNRAVEPATQLVKDFVAALVGRDADVNNKWIIDWRDGIIQFGKDAYAAHRVVIPAFDAIRDAASAVAGAISKMFGIGLTGDQILLMAALTKLVGGFALLRSSVMAAVQAIMLLSRVFWASPWTAVLAAVATGIGLWATRTNSATAAMEKHQGAVDSVAEAYRKAGGEVAKMAKEERARELNKQIVSAKELDAALETAVSKWQQALRSKLVFTAKDSPFRQIMEDAVKGAVSVQEFIAEVNRIGDLNSDFAEGAVGLTALSEGAEEVAKKSRAAHDWIALLRGETTDAGFQATKAGESFRGLSANAVDVTGDLKDAGAAAAETSAKVEELGRSVTVTKFGSGGPVKQVYDLADGVARAVDQSKISLDDLEQSASQTGQTIRGVSSEVAGAIRSVPEAFRSDAATAAVDSVVADVDRIAPAAQQAATNVQTALGNIDGGSAAQAADAILRPFESLPSKIDEILVAIRNVAQGGFSTLAATVRQIGSEIETMISRILNALRQAAAEAAKLRGSGSSSARAGGRGFSGGGYLGSGPGTSKSDSIPAWLSVGEFVIQAQAVRKFGVDFFAKLNRGIMPAVKGFSSGGIMDGLRSSLSSFNIPQFDGGFATAALAPSGVSGRPVVLQLPGGPAVAGFTGTDDAIEQVRRHAAAKAMTSAGRKPGWYK